MPKRTAAAQCDDGQWKWIEDRRTLYRLNTARLAVWDATVPLACQSPAFVARQPDLTTHLCEMQVRCEMYRQERHLHQAKRPILDSLHNHWAGLTVFMARPEVALDNNSAERALRTPVVGRKNYYGSRQYLECVSRRDDVQRPPNGAGVGAQSTPLVERVLRCLCRAWRPDPDGPPCFPALADDRRAETPARSAYARPSANLR